MKSPGAGNAGGVALVASGDEWCLRSLESILSAQDIQVIRAQTAGDAFESAQTAAAHIVLIDEEVAGVPGAEICRALRALPTVGASTPIIMLRHRPWRREERAEALAAGAWACVAIPVDSDELLLQVHTYVSARRETDTLRDAGLLDLLTGGYNAFGLIRRVREMASEAIRFSRPLGCVALSPEPAPAGPGGEVDNTVEFLRATLRGSDVVGRIGPAEFVILAANSGTAGTRRLAQRLLDAADHLPGLGSGHLALRAGYFAVDDIRASELDPEELVRRAEAALRQSQASAGAERLMAFSPEVNPMAN